MTHHCTLEYLYRDAANFKAWGSVFLVGRWNITLESAFRQCCDGGEFFVAEQVGLPPLYEELWAYSGGVTADDVSFHQFHALRPATQEEAEEQQYLGTIQQVLHEFQCAAGKWNPFLSPHGVLP